MTAVVKTQLHMLPHLGSCSCEKTLWVKLVEEKMCFSPMYTELENLLLL